MADSKPKKRLIAASSDEDEEAGLPLSKRVKAETSDGSGDNKAVASGSSAPGVPSTATSGLSAGSNGDSSHDQVDSNTSKGQQKPDTVMAPPAANGAPKAQPIKMEPEESSEDEALVKKAQSDSAPGKGQQNGAKANGKAPKKRASKAKKQDADSSDLPEHQGDAGSDFSEDEKPLSKRAAPKKAPAKRKSSAGTKSKDTSAEPPKKRAATKAKPKKEATPISSPVKKAKPEDDGSEADGEDDEENKFAFLNAGDEGTGEKWQTLEHSGVLFPPDYEPMPKNVKLYYDGKPVDLPPESEEVAGFFAGMLDTDHVQKDVFRENFFNDFRSVLEEHPPLDGTEIKEFDKCDFRPMADWFEAERQRKKSMSAAEKKRIKAEKDAAEEKYKTCKLNGKVEKVGNFRVEPPALFRGRGAHPKTGKLKTRVQPEQITINIGKDAPVPEPPAGHKWGAVQHDNTVSWLALWKENINGAYKYVFLAAGSSLKGESDFKKFEKARKLKFHIDDIRREYETQLKDKTMATRQRATAVYLIDRFALRAGNEKGEDEAETVGCCSLKCGNITLTPPCNVLFDFLGKDSIRFLQAYDVSEQVFKNLRIFKKEPKTDDDLIFDRLNTTLVNTYLRNHMEGLSAKVFRTYNASWTFQQELDKRTNPDDSVYDKILSYNRANRDVAVLCNHQRSVAQTHGNSMTKMQDKLKALKYQRRKLRWALFGLDDDSKEQHKEYADDESDLDEDWVAEHEESLRETAKERARKRFERDQVKKEEEDSKEGVKEEAEEKKTAPPAKGKGKRVKKEEEDEDDEDDDEEEEKPKKRKGKKAAAKAKKEEDDEEEDVKPAKGGRKPRFLTEEDLEKLLTAADDDYEKNREETRTQTVETNKTESKLLAELEKKDQQIAAHRSQITDRDEGKEVSLGTSKLNYIDPRLTFAWCKKYEVPIEKMFSKTLREKFAWAASTPADWRF